MSNLQTVSPFIVPALISPGLIGAFQRVPLNWATEVHSTLPKELYRWVDSDDEDRESTYKRPPTTDERVAWTASYKQAESHILSSLPSSFVYELGKTSKLQLGFGKPLDLYLFIQHVDTFCSALDVSGNNENTADGS